VPAFEKLQKGTLPPECRMLDVELEAVHKNGIQIFGVPEGIALLPKSVVLLPTDIS